MQFSLCSSRRFWHFCFDFSHLLLGCLKALINFLNKATQPLTLTRWPYHWTRGLSTSRSRVTRVSPRAIARPARVPVC